MKSTFLILAAITIAAGSMRSDPSTPSQQRVAFTRDSDVWIVKLDGTGSRKLSAGENPSVAPDGTKVAFTWEPPGNNNPLQRYISIIELATGYRVSIP
jgi:hypothetical protein